MPVAAVAAALALNAFSGNSTDLDRCSTQGDPISQASCLNGYFREAASRGRVNKALGELETRVRTGELDDCHVLAHAFGHVAFSELGNLGEALTAGGTQCFLGYQHGVVEAAVGGAGSRAGALHAGNDKTCAEQLELDLLDACIHGLGHAYMYLTGHDVQRSLARCGAQLASSQVPRCRDGVMMENSMKYLQLGANGFRSKAPSACDGLKIGRKLLVNCYTEIGEVGMFFFRHRLADVAPVCRAIASPLGRRSCLQGAQAELQVAQSRGF